MTKPKIRRLFFDIEVSPNIVFSWRVGFNLNLFPENIIEERKIICIGYKWEHEKKARILTWDKNQNDRKMIGEFLKIIDSADELVLQNGVRFDVPWFKTRCIYHGLQCRPDYLVTDTLKLARKIFYFNSNKLDYMAKFLGMEGKIKTDFSLWKNIVLHKDQKALDKMVKYCLKDVIILEKVYNKIKLFAKDSTHVGVMSGYEKFSCPKCASRNVTKQRTIVKASGALTHNFKCRSCGGYHNINDKALKEYNEAKMRK